MKLILIICTAYLITGYVYGATTTISSNEDNEVDTEKPSVVSRLDPILKKALLQALTNLENDSEEDETEEYDQFTDHPTTLADDELLEESTTSDQTPTVQYHTFIVDQPDNATIEKDSNENEIIKTIIVKSKKPASAEKTKDEKKNKDVVIRFDNLDPVKESDIRVETIQIARSVTASDQNEITNDSEKSDNKSTKSSNKSTTVKQAPTTTTTTTTTTKAPTHNEDGENIEKVEQNDVKIYQAPLVTAFTIQQDELGMPQNVIPLLKPSQVAVPITSQPIEQFTLTTSQALPTTTASKFQTRVRPLSQFNYEKTLTLQSGAFNPYILEQKQKQLEQQIAYLQAQQRQQESLFRQQQQYHDQQAVQRQQQLLQEQRLRIEEDYRIRQQKYEQEVKIYRQQQELAQKQFEQQLIQQNKPNTQQQQQVTKDPKAQDQQTQQQQLNLNQQRQQQQQLQYQEQVRQQQFQQQQQQSRFNNHREESRFNQQIPTTVQILPSLSFIAPVPYQTQQLLPVRDASEFRARSQQHQSLVGGFPLNQLIPPSPPQLLPGLQLPQRSFQQFGQPQQQQQFILDPITASSESENRNRVFRQETDTGNAGFNQFRGSNLNQASQADNYLQNLLFQSGISGRQNEDLNIITKVLALNHGISAPVGNFLPSDSRRFTRSIAIVGEEN